MFHLYIAFLLSLFFTYSISNDTNNHYSNRSIVPSRSIYELVQIRRAAARLAAYRNQTHQRNNANTNEVSQIDYNSFDKNNNNKYLSIRGKTISNNNHHRYLADRKKIIIIIGCIAVGFMILICSICVVTRYIQNKHPISRETSEQSKPLNASRQISSKRYYEPTYDTRKFSRKPRKEPTAV